MTDRNPELWFGVEMADEAGVTLGTCGGILLDGDGVETWLVVRGDGNEPAGSDEEVAAANGAGHRGSARVVPIAGAERTDGVVRTPYPADLVRGGPAFPPDVMILTEAERAALRGRYGLRADPAPAPPAAGPEPTRPAPPAEPEADAAAPTGGGRRRWAAVGVLAGLAVALLAVALRRARR